MGISAHGKHSDCAYNSIRLFLKSVNPATKRAPTEADANPKKKPRT